MSLQGLILHSSLDSAVLIVNSYELQEMTSYWEIRHLVYQYFTYNKFPTRAVSKYGKYIFSDFKSFVKWANAREMLKYAKVELYYDPVRSAINHITWQFDNFTGLIVG